MLGEPLEPVGEPQGAPGLQPVPRVEELRQPALAQGMEEEQDALMRGAVGMSESSA